MPNITQVTLTNGLPTAGSGNVSTIDALITSGMPISANVVIGTGTNQIGNVSVSNGAVSLTAVDRVPGTTNTVLMSSDGTKKTYRYAVLGIKPAANTTDFIRIIGSNTATVRVKRIAMYARSGIDDRIPVQLLKYSTIGTIGANAVYSSVTPMKHDNNDANSSANVSYVTNANPAATGTLVSTGDVGLFCVGPGNPSGSVDWNYCRNQDKAVILRGNTDILAVNFNSFSMAGDVLISFVVETEEDNS